ncbi:oxaloacetate decarboxylase alpha subunit [Novosphingobium hassiacum]|uniref:Oxaloacetate decarboxylase alpha subunit n=1 Tax=Novosphingobium hassiacum TaxID=173676 RepID=A0A7W6EWI2_9SPHN|nr:biotin carboxyl carrier protein [Novosphingobium hassiacum]MBB3861256.1 oxaloacetate decarboxylase alpha subunit [Novosphingobium hassiacum]
MTEIRLVDVTMRDGNQSLWGATGLNTAHMLQAAALTEACGFRAIDFSSSSHMAVAVRYFRNDPWERMRRMRAAMPTTPLQFITTGLRFIAWQQADPEFMRLVYRALQANGVGRFVLLDPMHEVPAVIEAARLVKAEGDAEVMCALTFTLSEIHTDEFYANFAMAVGQSADIDLYYIKDPAGLLSVDRVRTLVPAIKAVIGDKALEIHAHTTVGQGMLSSLEAARLGVSAIHVGVGAGGDGSSLPEANRMVANLEEAGFLVGIDKPALARLTTYWNKVAAAEGLPPGRPQNFDASFLRHQIAGGVMTTIARQLEELGLADRMDAVIEETGQVRADLGYPIMVTPFPQMVMTQALFNVIGDRRYAQVSDQVIRYCMGKFGKPTSPVDPAVLATIMDRPRSRELENEPMFPAVADLRRQFGSHLPDEEFLLRAVMPGEQVDAMLAAGPSRSTYTPEAAPIISLLRQLAARPHARDIVVERGGLRMALHAGASL